MPTNTRRLETGAVTPTGVGANLVLRFLVELGAYASLAYWGASTGTTGVSRAALAVLAPATAMGIWSLYLAPRARRRLPDPAAFTAELGIFGASAVALASTGQTALAGGLAAVAAANTVLVRVLDRRARSQVAV
jgi:hypothetical protein